MTNGRSYGEACTLAHALDLVGERWALLLVRELLLGPKRFSDLQRGIPGASPNVLTQRLRELEQTAVVRRRTLGPPAGSRVYELTEWGQELEPVLLRLASWGRHSPSHRAEGRASTDALMLALRSRFDPTRASGLDTTLGLHLDNDRFCVRASDGALTVDRSDAHDPDATIHTDPQSFASLLTKQQSLDDLITSARLQLTGDETALQRLLDALT